MTAGALYQINNLNTNSENNFLDFDPQITFFKVVYRKHTRFSIENIRMDPFNRQTLDFDNNVTLKCDTPRYGDLLSQVYFTFDLPDIWSGKYDDNAHGLNYEFQWIKNIGTNIFNHASVRISDQEIEMLYSDFMIIWRELMLSTDRKNQIDMLTGNIPELYDPAYGPGMNGKYPHITSSATPTIQSGKWVDQSSQIITKSSKSEFTLPSIMGRKLRVPLSFWFCNDPGLSLPMIALQYSIISFEFEMKAFKDLYTIIDVDSSNISSDTSVDTSFGKRIKPTNDTVYDMDNFADNYVFNINPRLEGEYIFLSEEERRRFAVNDHDYLITQPRVTDKNGIDITQTNEETMAKLVPAFNPVSYVTWVIKRSDLHQVNDWNNFTNWTYEDVPPYSYQNQLLDIKFNKSKGESVFYNRNITTHKAKYERDSMKKQILTDVRIEFDGVDRINKNAEYFSQQQPFQYFKNNPKNGIYVYSFSLNPKEYQPSGSCNFSLINYPRIYFKRTPLEDFAYYYHKAYIYIVSYNIFSISNGIGNTKFTN
jgi:hypothetical protein